MPVPDLDRIDHMLEAAREAAAAVRGRTRADLDSDRLLRRALERLIEIVGEAARHVTQATRDLAPAIPWRQIAGARDRVIHGYDTVDLDIVWDVAATEMPTLIAEIEKLRPRVAGQSPS